MDAGVKEILTKIQAKPLFFPLVTLVYLALLVFSRWGLYVTFSSLVFVLGGIVGVYLIDVTEAFMNIRPSPFRSQLFCYAFVVVSFFVVSSSGSMFASGLVLSMYVTLILWQVGQLRLLSNLNSWFRGSIPMNRQMIEFTIFICLFIAETVLFIRGYPV